MRKLKIALLIALILCLVCGVLVACDPIGKDPGAPDTPGIRALRTRRAAPEIRRSRIAA